MNAKTIAWISEMSRLLMKIVHIYCDSIMITTFPHQRKPLSALEVSLEEPLE